MKQTSNQDQTVRVYLCKEFCALALAGKPLPKEEASVAEQEYPTVNEFGEEVLAKSYLVKPFFRNEDSVEVLLG